MSSRNLRSRLETLERVHRNRSTGGIRMFPSWLRPQAEEHGWITGSAQAGEWKYDALGAQQKFHQQLDPRFKGYSGPIGSGKSYALAYEALFLSQINAGLMGLVGAPTYKMLDDSTKRTFFEVLEAENIHYVFTKQDNRIRFPATR